jgi:hypothetical protein
MCGFTFETTKVENIYILTGTKDIDCIFWNKSLDSSINPNKKIFAQIKWLNDSTYDVQYIDTAFVKEMTNILDSSYFPNKILKKKR